MPKWSNYDERLLARFWAKVDKRHGLGVGDCWLWTGSTRQRYGQLIRKTATGFAPIGAHRISYEIHYGSVAEGKVVCHKCDVPGCVNPAHLHLGSYFQNNTDAAIKGRGPTLRKQEDRVKLTDEACLKLKAARIEAGTSAAAMGKKIGMHFTAYSRLENGKRPGITVTQFKLLCETFGLTLTTVESCGKLIA